MTPIVTLTEDERYSRAGNSPQDKKKQLHQIGFLVLMAKISQLKFHADKFIILSMLMYTRRSG